ncbi:MAG: YbjN domain-containing protein [Bacteroidales bacterium]|nr:YbjN domain-containing protein [Bacteroidales bacterium]
MNVKGLVSKYLKVQGIVATKNELGLNFTYEGWNFLFWNDADDPQFFRLTLPGIFDVTDDNFAKAIMACNNINWNYKVVKAVLYDYEDGKEKGASVWMCYEQVLDADPDMDTLMRNAIQSLLSACDAFTKEMNND